MLSKNKDPTDNVK